MAQPLLLAGLVLSSIWGKARTKDGLDLQRKRPAAGARSQAKGGGGRKGTVNLDQQRTRLAAEARSRGR
jgi:hypothetical protein